MTKTLQDRIVDLIRAERESIERFKQRPDYAVLKPYANLGSTGVTSMIAMLRAMDAFDECDKRAD